MNDYDALLLRLADGLPAAAAKRYEMHCAPDVLAALKDAALSSPDWSPEIRFGAPAFGRVDVFVDDTVPAGSWRITENGETVKEGVL